MESFKNMFSDPGSSDTAQIVSNVTGIGQDEENTCCPSLDWSTRLQGFAFCFGIGLIQSVNQKKTELFPWTAYIYWVI